jgi:hypothetical protein
MKRVVLMLALAGAACACAAGSSFAQPAPYGMAAPAPAALQESPQAVRAAIPVQGKPAPAPTPARTAETPGQERPFTRNQFDADPVNIRLEVVISYQVGSAAPVKRSATLTVADQGRGSLRSGTQVAVPDTQLAPTPSASKPDGGSPAPAVPVTRFQYRSVGLNVDANRVGIVGNKARLELSVEFSAIDDKSPDSTRLGASPSFPTFSQNLTLVVENGKPLVIAQTSDVVDNVVRRQSVEVTATILR